MKLLNEPLLHFLLIGGVLFALSAWSNPDGAVEESDTRIVVPTGRIEQLARIFVKTWQRPPNAPGTQGARR